MLKLASPELLTDIWTSISIDSSSRPRCRSQDSKEEVDVAFGIAAGKAFSFIQLQYKVKRSGTASRSSGIITCPQFFVSLRKRDYGSNPSQGKINKCPDKFHSRLICACLNGFRNSMTRSVTSRGAEISFKLQVERGQDLNGCERLLPLSLQCQRTSQNMCMKFKNKCVWSRNRDV
jgi:hypothetical protein